MANTSKTIQPQDSLILEILSDEFGCHSVDRALTYKTFYRQFKTYNPCLMSDIFNALSHNWQMGKARDYLESLEEWLQSCLICHLAEDYFYDQPVSGYRLFED